MQNALLHDQRGRTRLAIVVAALVGLALVLAAAQAFGRGLSDQPESIAYTEESYYFNDVASMTATADVVVHGTVNEIQPGRTMGEDGGLIKVRALSVAVDKVLVSRMPLASGSTITVEEAGWDAQGNGFMIEGMPWSEAGQSGYFFLKYLPQFKTYRAINSQGRALDAGGQLVPSSNGEVAGELARMTPPQLEEALARARTEIDAGRLKPVPSVAEMYR